VHERVWRAGARGEIPYFGTDTRTAGSESGGVLVDAWGS
jgi:hypothetical protein